MIDTKTLHENTIFQYSWGWIHEDPDVNPRKYFDFAQLDRNDGTSGRYLVNSVSNSKRALHLRMENLYNGFGGLIVAGKPHNFPGLMGFLRKCGIVSPRILDRINKLRNTIEHDYYVPTINEVDTFLDVTELFLAATDMLISRQPSTIEFESDKVRDQSGKLILIEMEFDWKLGQISLWFSADGRRSYSNRVIQCLDSSSDEYFDCVRFAIRYNE